VTRNVRVIVDGHELVGDLRGELCIIYCCELGGLLHGLVGVESLLHLVLEVWLAHEILHLILCPLLPAIDVQAVPEEDRKLEEFLRVKIRVQHLRKFSEIQSENLLTVHHVSLGLCQAGDLIFDIFGRFCPMLRDRLIASSSHGRDPMRVLRQILVKRVSDAVNCIMTLFLIRLEYRPDAIFESAHWISGTTSSVLRLHVPIVSWI
jgi:hypothetical protein